MAPDWKATWKQTLEDTKKLREAGAIIGVFLGDEHLYFGIQLSEVKEIADQIRLDWPECVLTEPCRKGARVSHPRPCALAPLRSF
jgi:hypothetical protein